MVANFTYFTQFNIKSCILTVCLLDPLIEPYQVLPLRIEWSKESKSNEEVRYISKITMAEISPSDGLLLYPGHRDTFFLIYCHHHHHHHHHVVPLVRISLTLSRNFSLSFIAFGRSSGLHPVSSHSCCRFELVVLLLLGHMRGPLEYITDEFVLASPAVSCVSGSSNLYSFRDGRPVAV